MYCNLLFSSYINGVCCGFNPADSSVPQSHPLTLHMSIFRVQLVTVKGKSAENCEKSWAREQRL